MKIKMGIKALILGAVLFAEAAHAQSSVQLYGLLDAFVGYKKPMNGQSSVIAGNGGMTAPYFGLRGSEDIGGGTKVIFDLEGYFNVQNGSMGRTGFPHDGLFSRNAYVGASGQYGTATAGLIPPLLWFSTITFNPFGNSFVFSPIVLHSYVGVNGQGVFGNAGEWWNSVYYASPSFNGLAGRAMYSFGNDPGHLGQATLQIGEVARAEADRGRVELAVAIRQRERVGLLEHDARGNAGRRSLVTRQRQHRV